MRQAILRASFAALLLALGAAAPAAWAEKIYKWVDEAGVTHYGQRLPKGQRGVAIELERASKPEAAASERGKPGGAPTEFYGLPVPADAKVRQRVERSAHPGILVYTTSLGVEEVLAFYRDRYGPPARVERQRRSQVMTYLDKGRVAAMVAVGTDRDGTRVDLRVEPPVR